MYKTIAILLLVFVVGAFSGPTKLTSSIRKCLQAKSHCDIVLSFPSTRPQLYSLQHLKFNTRAEKLTAIASTLQTHATETQKSVTQFLSLQKGHVTFNSYWITNKIFIRNAGAELIQSLANFEEIWEIREEIKGNLFEPFLPVRSTHRNGSIEWGLERINVKNAWARGINGTGVTVGVIDSGVRVSHESLRDNFIGEYGWFSPDRRTETPDDYYGHGTHCTGTILGQGGIGVAPGAKWMACQIVGSEQELIDCGQFMACPHLFDGSNPDCSKAPHIVSNSWGLPPGVEFYEDVLVAWVAGGIVPVFAAGNEGPSCRSVASPGDSTNPAVITVGATDSSDRVSEFSSLGPTVFCEIKPNIAAPGTDIRSAGSESDSSYVVESGTSMATPHVAGVVALILSANPKASIQEIQERLYNTATESISSTGGNCGDVPETSYPNNHVGHGFLSANAAL